MDKFQPGDLVQFSQTKTNSKHTWEKLPMSFQDFKTHSMHVQRLLTYVMDKRTMLVIDEYEKSDLYYTPAATAKDAMVVVSTSQQVCLTTSPLAFAREQLTKSFIQVMVFKDSDGHTRKYNFWVLESDVVPYVEKTYMQEFVTNLRVRLGQKMSNGKK